MIVVIHEIVVDLFVSIHTIGDYVLDLSVED